MNFKAISSTELADLYVGYESDSYLRKLHDICPRPFAKYQVLTTISIVGEGIVYTTNGVTFAIKVEEESSLRHMNFVIDIGWGITDDRGFHMHKSGNASLNIGDIRSALTEVAATAALCNELGFIPAFSLSNEDGARRSRILIYSRIAKQLGYKICELDTGYELTQDNLESNVKDDVLYTFVK